MDDYKIIVEQEHQTVMAHYEVEPKPDEGYQSEAALEKSLIMQLQGQGYEYAHIKDEAGLLGNSFLSSLLKSKIFQTPIKQKSSGGALQAISFGLIKDISVPVPPLQEQQRIVSILDTFEASIQNLEAQLSQREKQYEYYRNKLLTFD